MTPDKPMSSAIESLLNTENAPYLAELYDCFLADPHSVDATWAALFAGLPDPAGPLLAHAVDPDGTAALGLAARAAGDPGILDDPAVRQATLDSIRALMIIRVYRVRGHLLARVDPLGLEGGKYHPELDPKTWGFAEEDMDRPIFINQVLGLETATPREIMRVLEQTYCGSVGVEFMHIQDPEEKAWIQQRIESIGNQTHFTDLGKRTILERLTQAEGFERFLHLKYPGTKRFGLDGGESTIPALEQILKRASHLGVRDIDLGMSHRGRLNVLANIMLKPYRAIMAEFDDCVSHPEDVQGSGDVKYHLGASADRSFDGHEVHLSLAANPSHLEAVNPVVLGKIRARQTRSSDVDRARSMAILLHGDAAFAGQGLVAECLGLSELQGYRTGGTIHFIINNQIGFTTNPVFSRSSPYSSDVAKTVQAPIFHVNGDDPEAVVHIARIATEFRCKFRRDVVIDMFCYRRYGHNEADEPAFTQPRMYRAIGSQPTTRAIYAEQLIREQVMSREETDQLVADFQQHLSAEFEASRHYQVRHADWLQGPWEGYKTLSGEEEMRESQTAVAPAALRRVGAALTRLPEGFNLHPRLRRQFDAKAAMLDTGTGIDWATAEALAFGTLLAEGVPVRLSGQDSGRGTFSQRHAVLIDQADEHRYIPLNHIGPGQSFFEVIDSPLSEASVLGFEYGYSLADPGSLVLWEAQFGDFANGAQVIIDQFIAAAESKWLRLSGLVLLLPHGFDGQGAEHSSARPERYLQLCAEDNLQVLNCTTPANYFHALRRQVCRNFRKPLVLFSPKSLLRNKLAISDLADLGPGTGFQRVLPESQPLQPEAAITRLVLCSGKIYYELLEDRRRRGLDTVALVRIEQLYPWPRLSVLEQIARHTRAEVLWCQEEPANMGAWTFVLPRLINILEELGRSTVVPTYVGRPAAAAVATGSHKKHEEEQARLVAQALSAKSSELPQPFRRVPR